MNPKRHTHSTLAALEDALAVALEIIENLQIALLYAQQRMDRIQNILKAARKSPHAYDPETPSGKRVIIKKR